MPTTLSAVPELDFDGRILFWRASCSVMTFRSAAPSARHLLLPVAPEVVVGEEPFSTPRKPVSWSSTGADDGIRTRDPNLGNVGVTPLWPGSSPENSLARAPILPQHPSDLFTFLLDRVR